MSESTNPGAALVTRIMDLGLEGKAPGMKSSSEIAADFQNDRRYATDDDRVDSIIRWHTTRAGMTGFATGLGGIATMPVTIPSGLLAAWVIQARMVGAIAIIRGYDLEDERVRTFALAAVLGDAFVVQVTKELGAVTATKMGTAAIARVPGKVFIEINKKMGFRFITKAGSKGVVNVTKFVPVLGGLVGGTVDASATRTVGAVAKRTFTADVSATPSGGSTTDDAPTWPPSQELLDWRPDTAQPEDSVNLQTLCDENGELPDGIDAPAGVEPDDFEDTEIPAHVLATTETDAGCPGGGGGSWIYAVPGKDGRLRVVIINDDDIPFEAPCGLLSELPSLRELLRILDETLVDGETYGVGHPSRENSDVGEHREELRGFLTIDSELYPALWSLDQSRLEQWIAEKP